MQDTEYPVRTDSRYYTDRRKELEAARKVLLDHTQDAKRRHIDDLMGVIAEWKEDLGNDSNDVNVPWESLVPSAFSDADREPRIHNNASIKWQVTGDRGVEVWMKIEQRKQVLFKLLLGHIGEEIGTTYDSLKSLLIQEIQYGNGQANSKITISGYSQRSIGGDFGPSRD